MVFGLHIVDRSWANLAPFSLERNRAAHNVRYVGDFGHFVLGLVGRSARFGVVVAGCGGALAEPRVLRSVWY